MEIQMIPLEEIFCFIDDFCKGFEQYSKGYFLGNPARKRKRACHMSLSEIMTILILFQFSHYRTFKDFYYSCLIPHYKTAFPKLVSYNRFLELIPYAIMPMIILLLNIPGKKTGKYFTDSTKLFVCDNLRINRHKVFEGFAKRGKTSTGWFFGFKLHLIINDKGELMSFRITPGNKDDRCVIEKMSKGLQGWLFGDKGYISKDISEKLSQQGLELITRLKKNMKDQFLDPIKKCWLDKRGIIETTIGQLKSIFHIQHTRHRSIPNFFANVLAGMIAYVFKPKKPNVSFSNAITHKFILTSS
jgi:hypothetical protein